MDLSVHLPDTLCGDEHLAPAHHHPLDYTMATSSTVSECKMNESMRKTDCTEMIGMILSIVSVVRMHQFLNKRLLTSFYMVKDISNPSHGLRLFRAVKHLNSYNMYV